MTGSSPAHLVKQICQPLHLVKHFKLCSDTRKTYRKILMCMYNYIHIVSSTIKNHVLKRIRQEIT